MYKGVPFRRQKLEVIEEDLKELARDYPNARTIQLLSGNPLALSYENLLPVMEMINRYLPKVEYVYTASRVTDIRGKTVEQLKHLRELGLKEISLGIESADDATLDGVDKGYHASDIVEQCTKLEEAGIDYWMTFLNGIGGKPLWRDHALNSARIFSSLHPKVVGTGGLTLFPDTALYADARDGTFEPLDEKGLMEELLLFVENLDFDGRFITHHTSSINLNTDDFKRDKKRICAALRDEIEHGDLASLERARATKRGL